MRDDMKVVLGPVNVAGMVSMMATGLRRRGVDARSIQYYRGGYNTFDYPVDVSVDLAGKTVVEVMMGVVEECLKDGVDIFHTWNRSFVFGDSKSVPAGFDIPLIRASGRAVVHRFTGMDLRDYRFDMEHNPYSPFRYGYAAPSPAEEHRRQGFVEMISELASVLVVQDPEMGQYAPQARVIPRALDLNVWPMLYPSSKARPLVVHAPSDGVIKGTPIIEAAVAELADEGLEFDFKLVQGMSHADAKKTYEAADIIIDQLHIGAYGVLSLEGMAMGKTVLCYLRKDLFDPVYPDCPIVNVNPETLKDQLRAVIKDAELRQECALKGRSFVERHHALDAVLDDQIALYKEVCPKRSSRGRNSARFFKEDLATMQKERIRASRGEALATASTDRLRNLIHDYDLKDIEDDERVRALLNIG